MNGRLWPVIRREYMERVRSRAFLVATVLGPLLMSGMMIVPGLVMGRQRGKPLRIAVVDASGTLKRAVEESLAAQEADGQRRFEVRGVEEGNVDEVRARLKAKILSGALDGYVYLPPDAVASSKAEYHGKVVSNLPDLGLIDRAVDEAFVGARLRAEGLEAARLRQLMRKVDLKTIRVSDRGDREDRGGNFFLSVILMMILYTSLAMWGAALMNGVIEEKTNRVVEVVVSSVSPTRLFAGKLLGIGAAGLTQFLVWVAFMAVLAVLGARAAAGGARLPDLPPALMVFFVVFFLLGYFLYGTLYAAVGAAVNTTQEAQSLAFPVMMPLITAMMVFPAVLGAPDSTLSTVLSLVPFWTPLLMFLRISVLMPPAWQIALSIALTAVTIVALNWAAARIYRVGILMYGKRPTFPEILRWVRVR